MIAFVEKQGERTNERGGMSEETRSRMAGMFMEDEVLVTDLDDTITKVCCARARPMESVRAPCSPLRRAHK